MAVMVDELKVWPHAKHRCFKSGSAHLTTDGSLDELHAFAQRIGLRREWFQPHPSAPHYDLSPRRHAAALAAGAVFVSAREQARRRLASRAGRRCPHDALDGLSLMTRYVSSCPLCDCAAAVKRAEEAEQERDRLRADLAVAVEALEKYAVSGGIGNFGDWTANRARDALARIKGTP